MIGGALSGRTPLHALPAGAKLIALALATAGLFFVEDARALTAFATLALAAYLALGRGARARLTGFAPLLPLLAGVALLQGLANGPQPAVAAVARLTTMVLLADIVTMTTPMLAMMDAIVAPLAPLRLVGVDPRKLALAFALVVRFTPALLDEWRRREEAWRARTGRRASLRLLAPWLADLTRLADRVAESLDARGFGRSRE